jgi:hypothetical protein
VEAAGVSWQDLGVFQADSGGLNVQLAANATSPVLANAVMIVPYDTVPLTNLTIGSFTVDSQGNLSVSYTITGEDSPPFSIGVYGSPDGRQATNLLQTYPITDPTLLGGGGQSYTVTFPAALDSLSSSQYVIAELDSSDAVEETSKADDISAPLSGIFEQSDGTLFVLGNASSLTNENISLTQDLAGDVTVNTADAEGDPLTSSTFSGVASVIISTPGGSNTVNVDPSVTVPVSAFAGPGSSVAGTVTATDATPTVTIVSFVPTIDKGGVATLTADVGNLGGMGFTVTIDWGYYEGSDTIVYPPGTTSFTMTDHYVDDGSAPFDVDFPVSIDVTASDGQTADASASTMGEDVTPTVNITGEPGAIILGTPVALSAVVADPGEFGTFTYSWTVTGGTYTDPTGANTANFGFTPNDCSATDYTVSVAVTDADGNMVTQSVMIPVYVWPSGGASITPFVPDEPTVSIEQCDADGTPDATPVQAGSDAYFKISVDSGDDTPLQGTVTVYYNTANNTAVANTDYIATGGALTFTYDTGYASQVISVQTVVTSNGGTFTVNVPCLSDPFASTLSNSLAAVLASTSATIEPGLAIHLTTEATNQNDINVTDLTTTLIVGQWSELDTTYGGITVKTKTWSVPGTDGSSPDAVAGYSQSVQAGTLAPSQHVMAYARTILPRGSRINDR